MDGGPLVTVNPDGGMVVDYRNGTVKRMNGTRKGLTEEGKGGGRRSKRFNSIDDLWVISNGEGDHFEDFGDQGTCSMDGGAAEGIPRNLARTDLRHPTG